MILSIRFLLVLLAGLNLSCSSISKSYSSNDRRPDSVASQSNDIELTDYTYKVTLQDESPIAKWSTGDVFLQEITIDFSTVKWCEEHSENPFALGAVVTCQLKIEVPHSTSIKEAVLIKPKTLNPFDNPLYHQTKAWNRFTFRGKGIRISGNIAKETAPTYLVITFSFNLSYLDLHKILFTETLRQMIHQIKVSITGLKMKNPS